jgi:hypothetical protein
LDDFFTFIKSVFQSRVQSNFIIKCRGVSLKSGERVKNKKKRDFKGRENKMVRIAGKIENAKDQEVKRRDNQE